MVEESQTNRRKADRTVERVFGPEIRNENEGF